MSHEYYFNLVNKGTQLEVGETNEGNDWGVFYTTAKVTNPVEAWSILLPLLQREIRDGAVLNCHLGLAGICSSWAFDKASIVVGTKDSDEIWVNYSKEEAQRECQDWRTHEDIGFAIPCKDAWKVVKECEFVEFPLATMALHEVACAMARYYAK